MKKDESEKTIRVLMEELLAPVFELAEPIADAMLEMIEATEKAIKKAREEMRGYFDKGK